MLEMSTIIVGILTFISRKNSMLSCVEHEIFFLSLGPDCSFMKQSDDGLYCLLFWCDIFDKVGIKMSC